MFVAVTLHDVVYWAGIPVTMVGAVWLERRLSLRGWDLPRSRSDRLLGLGFLTLWIGVVRQYWGLLAFGAITLGVYAAMFGRRPSQPKPVTSKRGEAAVTAYLHSLSSTVPVVSDHVAHSTNDVFTLESIGRYERDGDAWKASLTTGRQVAFVLGPGGRAEFRAEDVLLHAGGPPVYLTQVSLGDLHAALAAMSARGVVDPLDGRPGWFTVMVV